MFFNISFTSFYENPTMYSPTSIRIWAHFIRFIIINCKSNSFLFLFFLLFSLLDHSIIFRNNFLLLFYGILIINLFLILLLIYILFHSYSFINKNIFQIRLILLCNASRSKSINTICIITYTNK